MDEKGGKVKVNQEKNVKVSESTNLENKVQNPPISVKVSSDSVFSIFLTLIFCTQQLCESECESASETEEMELDPDHGSLHEEDRVNTLTEDVKEGVSKVERAGDSFLPVETIDRKESVELWKSRNETDVIGRLSFRINLE